MKFSCLNLFNLVLVSILWAFQVRAVASADRCRSLFGVTDLVQDVFSKTPEIERPNHLVPWVKSKTTVILPKAVSQERLAQLETHLQELELLGQQFLKRSITVSRRQIQEHSAFFSPIVSEFLAHHRITHEVSEFTDLFGRKIDKIRILTNAEGANASVLGNLANRVDRLQGDLVFSVSYFLSHGIEGALYLSGDLIQYFHSRWSRAGQSLFFPISKDRSMLLLPIYAILNPDFAPYSPAINHEIHHLETFQKLRLKTPFPFYGTARFQDYFTFAELIEADQEVIATLNRFYKSMLFDEAPAMAVSLLEIKSSLRHSDSSYYKAKDAESELVKDISKFGGFVLAMNAVSKMIAAEVIHWTEFKSDSIRFKLNGDHVYAQIDLVLKKEGKDIEIELKIPLVASNHLQSKKTKLEHLRKQMEAMMLQAGLNHVLGEWATGFADLDLQKADDGLSEFELASIFVDSFFIETNMKTHPVQYRRNLDSRFKEAVTNRRRENR